jgi:hypothetical protein
MPCEPTPNILNSCHHHPRGLQSSHSCLGCSACCPLSILYTLCSPLFAGRCPLCWSHTDHIVLQPGFAGAGTISWLPLFLQASMEARARQWWSGTWPRRSSTTWCVVFPNVQPPLMATQLQNLGGISAIDCRWCFLRAQRPGSQSCGPPRRQGGARGETETETGLDNKSAVAVAFEKHPPHSAADGGGGMARLPGTYSRTPTLRPLLHRRRSCPRGPASR